MPLTGRRSASCSSTGLTLVMKGGGSATTTGQTIGEALAELGLPSRRGEAGLAAFRDEQDKEWTEGGKVQRVGD